MPIARSSGADIYYEVIGAVGPPLVLIRGFAGTTRSWNGIADELGRDHRAIVLDNRGVGNSTAPRGRYSVAEMAADVAAVLDAARFASAHVLGTSLGGMIAQEFAIRYPQRVRSLVLAGTTCGRPPGVPLVPRGVLAVALALTLPPRLRARVSTLATLSPRTRRNQPELIERRAEALRASPTPIAGIFGQACAIFGHRTAGRLDRISAPTLILHGGADSLIDCRNAEILGRLIPGAFVELWPGLGHDLASEAPQGLADRVRRHVRAESGECGRPTILPMSGPRPDARDSMPTHRRSRSA